MGILSIMKSNMVAVGKSSMAYLVRVEEEGKDMFKERVGS